MIRRDQILVFLVISILLPRNIRANNSSTKCKRSCGGGRLTLPYPFGFSAECEIPLKCNATGQKVFLGEFPVQSVSPDSIKINIERKCNRPLNTSVGQLFGPNYAPKSTNAILLENCTGPGSACEIPTILVQTHFSSLSCSSEDSNVSTISCYSERNTSAFINLKNLKQKKCGSLLSSISAGSLNSSESPLSLEVQVAELGWWMKGACQCDRNANCTKLVAPDGNPGYRCYCKEGFEGDGFLAGFGCRKGEFFFFFFLNEFFKNTLIN